MGQTNWHSKGGYANPVPMRGNTPRREEVLVTPSPPSLRVSLPVRPYTCRAFCSFLVLVMTTANVAAPQHDLRKQARGCARETG